MVEVDLGKVVGFSPTVTEDSGNDDSTYRLIITTENGSYTTPNLKGADGKDGKDGQDGQDGDAGGDVQELLNGLKFAQDGEGNWGYIPPGGADTVIPFRRGGGDAGGDLAGGEMIKSFIWPRYARTGTLNFPCSVILEKDYKYFLAIAGMYRQTAARVSVSPLFRTGSITMFPMNVFPVSDSTYMGSDAWLEMALDLNKDGLKSGDTYAFSFNVTASNTNSWYPFAYLFGFC